MSNYRYEDLTRFAGIFRALANPHRLKIYLKLVACMEPGQTCEVKADDGMMACVGELGQDLGLAPSTVSHHIRELTKAGLIHVEKSGQYVKCRVATDIMNDLSEFINNNGLRLVTEGER
jgi:ArsR family transcriptional regulator